MASKILVYFLLTQNFFLPVQGQVSNYTYENDREFNHPADLVGYTFIPNKYDFEKKRTLLEPGEAQLHFLNDELKIFLEGVSEKSLSIEGLKWNSKGILLSLAEKDSPQKKSSLQIFLNSNSEAYQILYMGPDEEEYLFYLPGKNPNQYRLEERYFTRAKDLRINGFDDLTGHEINPSFKVEKNASESVFQRIGMDENVSFWFLDKKMMFHFNKEVYRFNLKNVTLLNNPRSNAIISGKIEMELSGVKANKQDDIDKIKSVTVYVDDRRQIAYIAFGNNEYYLKP